MRAERPLTKHTMLLFEGDFAELQDLYPDIGASAMVRRLIEKYLERVRANGGPVDVNVEIKI